METVRRWDAGSVGTVERTDQGYLRAPATITKTGVFAYRLPGGKVRRELRLPDEVFREDTLASFGLSPLTNGHPPVMLNARNTARYQVGSVVEPRRDGNHVEAYVQITDADAIEAAEAGRRQLSCGYHCDLEPGAGVTSGIEGVPDGLHYDAIQRNIRGNHVALTDQGRCGKSVQLRLDSADAFQVDEPQWRYDRDPSTIQTLIFDPQRFTPKTAGAWAKEHGFTAPKGAKREGEAIRVRERNPSQFEAGSFRTIELAPGIQAVIGRPKKTDGQSRADGPTGVIGMDSKITVEGVQYDCTPQVEQAVGKLTARIDALSADLADQKSKLEAEKARADAAEEGLAAEKQARADAESPERVRKAVNARLALERAAQPILGSEAKLDGMDDAAIKAAVVVAASKDKDLAKERLDGCDAAYLQARYDAALEGWEQASQPNKGLAATRKAAQDATRTDSVSDARTRMIKHNREMGRKALN